jgi:soluble lytic murein transglycosylase-like protein
METREHRRARVHESAACAWRRALIALLVVPIACSFAAPAVAGYLCTDESGRSYALAQPVASGLAALTCVAQAVAPAAVKPGSAKDAALALGLTLPEPPSAVGGRLVLTVSGARAAASVSPAATVDRFDGLISAAARKFDHDVSLLRAIVHVESRFNPNALSPKGAIGLMQVMPQTARGIGVDAPETALFDPETNLLAGARYLRQLVDRFPDRPELAIAAYNAGEGAVMRYRRQIPPFPETQSYVRQVQAQYLLYRNP